MSNDERQRLMGRMSQEKGQRSAAIGDFAFLRVLDAQTQLAFVCDGEGRAEAERAAEALNRCLVDEAMKGLAADDAPKQILENALVRANMEVAGIYLGVEPEEGYLPGVSCAIALVSGNSLHLSHVGDCRVYLYRRGKLIFRTRDHTRAKELVEKLQITPQEEATHPDRFEAIHKVGATSNLVPDIRQQPIHLSEGDRIILCTDGIHDALEEGRIGKIAGGDNPMSIPDRLVEAAAVNGPAHDKAALVLVLGEVATDEEEIPVSLAPAATVKGPTGLTSEIPEMAAAHPLAGGDPDETATEAIADTRETVVAAVPEHVPRVAAERESVRPDADTIVAEPWDAAGDASSDQALPTDAEEDEYDEAGTPPAAGMKGLLHRLFRRGASEDEPTLDGENSVGGATAPHRLGRFELGILIAIVLLGMILAAVYLFDGSGSPGDGFQIGGEGPTAEDTTPGQEGEAASETEDETPEVAGMLADAGASRDLTGLSPDLAEMPEDDPVKLPPVSTAVHLCKLANGSAQQCACYLACLKAVTDARNKVDESIRSGRSDECSSLIDKSSVAWRTCRVGKDCLSFDKTMDVWRSTHEALKAKCGKAEDDRRRKQCANQLSNLGSLSVVDVHGCEKAEDAISAALAGCREWGRSNEVESHRQKVAEKCKRVRCDAALDEYNQYVSELETKLNSYRSRPTDKERICNQSPGISEKSTARRSCDDDRDIGRIESIHGKRNALCNIVRVTPPANPPTDCWSKCSRAIKRAINGRDRHVKLLCLGAINSLRDGTEAYRTCHDCGERQRNHRKATDKLEAGKRDIERKCRDVGGSDLPPPDDDDYTIPVPKVDIPKPPMPDLDLDELE